MDKAKKDLYVFGYGMGLIIPYLVFFHSLSLGVHWWSVLILLGGFALILWLTTKIAEVNPKLNAWIFVFQLLVAVDVVRAHAGALSLMFLCIAAAFLMTAVTGIERLEPVYKAWMKVGHKINECITVVVLGIMYYFVFTPVALFLRLAKKDYLNRAFDPNASSYWIQREEKPFNREQYTKQF